MATCLELYMRIPLTAWGLETQPQLLVFYGVAQYQVQPLSVDQLFSTVSVGGAMTAQCPIALNKGSHPSV